MIDFRDRKTVYKDSIKQDGTFKIVLDLYAKQDIVMRPLLDRVILQPGDSLFIQMDFGDISQVHFSGDRAKTNELLRKYLWSNSGSLNFYVSDKVDPTDYKTHCDSILIEKRKMNSAYFDEENPPKEVVQWISDNLTINYFKSLLTYPRNYYSRNNEGYRTWFKTTTYFDFADTLENSFKEYGGNIVNSDIYELLEAYEPYLIRKAKKSVLKENEKGISLNMVTCTIINNHQNTNFRQMVLGNFYYQLLCSNLLTALDESKNLLDSIIQEPFLRKPLFDFYNDLKKNKGNPEFGSNAILAKMGVEGKVLLDSIIAQHKGKVLFVDLWATWCGPCLEGMATAKEIMPRYENKDIEFIFLCVNSTEENWKTILSKYKIGGKHYFCTNNQSRDIRRALGVEYIPHYLIINKNGHIVEQNGQDLAQSRTKIDKLLVLP